MTEMTDLLCYLIFTAVTLLLVGYKSTSGSTSVIFGCIFFAENCEYKRANPRRCVGDFL